MAQVEQEMSLDDFQLEAPKVVPVITKEQMAEKVGQTNAQGQVQTFSKIEKDVISNLDKQVDGIMVELLTAPMHSSEMKDLTSALNAMGDKEINETSQMSNRMLQRPLRAMRQNDFGDGKSVASALKDLRMKVTELDPSNRDALFSKNKFLGIKLPFGIGNKVDSYMQEFKSSETQLNDIVKSLLNGKDELIEDNAVIQVERENMANLMQRLEQYAYIMKKLDQRIEEKLPEIQAEDQLRASDIKQEILFPIRQKSMDIYQHLAVCMQGYMSLQVVKKNNDELIRGVDRATKTTISALRTAVIVSEALGTQKLVLDQIDAVNDVTNKLIMGNAERLQQQGVEIQKRATTSAVDPEVLKKSFEQIFKAMDAIDSFREQALPNMKKTVESLEQSVNHAKEYLSKNRQDRIGSFQEEIMKEESPEDKKVVRVRP
jgi:uncharacterized protein YaaN involved in tellurite resistance